MLLLKSRFHVAAIPCSVRWVNKLHGLNAVIMPRQHLPPHVHLPHFCRTPALTATGIIPSVIPGISTKSNVGIDLLYNGKIVNGATLTLAEVAKPLEVKVNGGAKNALYTLVVVNPEAPQLSSSGQKISKKSKSAAAHPAPEHMHMHAPTAEHVNAAAHHMAKDVYLVQVITNIHADEIASKGDVRTLYQAPERSNAAQRLVYVLYEQHKGHITILDPAFELGGRTAFRLGKFAQNHELGEPFAAEYVTVSA